MKSEEFIQRKPGRFTVMDRCWVDDEPYVTLLQDGRAQAINVRWEDFKRDYEVVSPTNQPAERNRVGEWIPLHFIDGNASIAADRTALCTNDDPKEDLYVRVFGSTGHIFSRRVSRDDWDSARAEWFKERRGGL